MPGMTQINNISLSQIMEITNSSSLPEFFIKINHDIYGGWFWFIILLILGVIMYVSAQKLRDLPLNNALYVSAGLSIIALLMRAVVMTRNGVVQGLIDDFQLWIFPVLTLILALIVWATSE